jgi:hypothetical protein
MLAKHSPAVLPAQLALLLWLVIITFIFTVTAAAAAAGHVLPVKVSL